MRQILSGKVAIVTGASKGIGAEIARQLGAAGASVVVNYSSSREDAERVAGGIVEKGGSAIAVQADVSQQSDIKRLFVEAQAAMGRLDILVNNAGVYEFMLLEDVTAEHFHRTFDLNVLGLILTSQEALKHFGPEGGTIINISSVFATTTMPTASIYSASKAAVDAVTKTLAKEIASRGIRVNSINPGIVETEGTRAQGIVQGDYRKQIESQTPVGRIGRPQDVAPVVVFLASSDASWITGETFYISGGFR